MEKKISFGFPYLGLILLPLLQVFDLTPNPCALTNIGVLGAPGNNHHGKYKLEIKSDKPMPSAAEEWSHLLAPFLLGLVTQGMAPEGGLLFFPF